MAKKPFGGNYLKVEFRVSYDKKTDSINLTSKDKDLQGEKGFRLTLNRGRDAEHELRKLLEREGLIPKGKPKEIPDRVLFANSQ
ncbi:MAG TPA: hypothetical protein VLR52_00745, partial [Bacteroidales bacterium]|nr:hypothetical protein [Bacteroidales bacterium]